ncbi:type IV pilus assembly protein PilA [Sanguibacter gelidistatuariae]|uniref:Type IV pilus assembly protein PilA n=1 Tax=Sanguibacter gelidistatuariae TaxID=1814289 RepID=A0A1G6JUF0_9MICO|nr:prepilin-type N-terminal cleavage/methylation domain-containing protein [Sanguibacter gelidistatuariae]SDC21616.1 type IV pilus assembly protein PilA [Sanguibacter gelidistatuariae]
MLIRINKAMNDKDRDKGFTLVELLVVIIIIGILAAIAIPAFLKQREKAWASAVTSDLKNASIAAESFATDHNGKFTGLDATALGTNGYNKTADVTAITVALVGTGDTGYTLTAGHANLSDTWTYSSTTGVIKKN